MPTEKEQEGLIHCTHLRLGRRHNSVLAGHLQMAWGHVPEPGGWLFYTVAEERRGVPGNKTEKDCSLPGLERSHGSQIK